MSRGRRTVKTGPALTPSEEAKAICDMQRPLVEWAKMAYQTHANYAGANDALRDRHGTPSTAASLAMQTKDDSALLTIMRLHALFSNGSEDTSLQRVYRMLTKPVVQEALIARTEEPGWPWRWLDCRAAIDSFIIRYRSVAWRDLHPRLSHFRNYALAHIRADEVEKFIKHGELESLLMLALDLVEDLSTFTWCESPGHRKLYDALRKSTRHQWIELIDREIKPVTG